jgi:hypothetical protein
VTARRLETHFADPLPAEATTPRRIWLFLDGEAVCCPHGHALTDSVVLLPSGIRQCRWRDYAQPTPGGYCGAWLWIWSHLDGSHTVVWIRRSERLEIERQRMTVRQARDYLGLARSLPPLRP